MAAKKRTCPHSLSQRQKIVYFFMFYDSFVIYPFQIQFSSAIILSFAAVAQLDRVLGYEPRGRGFDSCQPHQKTKGLQEKSCNPFLVYTQHKNANATPPSQKSAIRQNTYVLNAKN